jgi:hypothetical protein
MEKQVILPYVELKSYFIMFSQKELTVQNVDMGFVKIYM